MTPKLKRILKMTLIAILAAIIVIAVLLYIYFNSAPQIGGTAEGKRLERMQSSPQYQAGEFRNANQNKQALAIGKMFGAMWAFLTEGENKEPETTIRTYPFNAADIDTIPDDELAITWFGHSTLLIRIEGKTFLTDPLLTSERASMFSFMGPKRFPYDHYTSVDELPKIDAVIMSHDHYDHLDYETILDLKDKISHFYMPIGVGAHFEAWGVKPEQITELDWWETIKHDSIELVFTPTQHFSGRAFSDRNATLWGSWVIKGQKKRVYFSGDSGYFPGFKEIGDKYGPFDITLLECGAYNKRWADIHMFPEETVQANVDLSGKLMLPIHWGKYSLSTHSWYDSPERMIKKAKELNVDFTTPEVGQTIRLSQAVPKTKWWERFK
ncbi:MAG: MBL fold metallo-hydrolase [Calditrichaeota bacterium]|nr:MBL fold metallo-hydrolase [Calditrichota bacterium]